MAQSDLNIQNQLFPDARADINQAFLACATFQSGAVAPPIVAEGVFWLDTSSSTRMLRQYTGGSWVSLWSFDDASVSFNFSGSFVVGEAGQGQIRLVPSSAGGANDIGTIEYWTESGVQSVTLGQATVDGFPCFRIGSANGYRLGLSANGEPIELLDESQLITAQTNSNMLGSDTVGGILVRNYGGTGDGDTAAIAFSAATQNLKLALRSDGRWGVGSGSVGAWRWYVETTTGDMVAAGNVTAYSDARLKENIRPLENYWSILEAAEPVRFTWTNNGIVGRPGSKDVGVIAQKVLPVFPEAVNVGDNDMMTVSYVKFIAPLIAAVLDLQKQVAELQGKA